MELGRFIIRDCQPMLLKQYYRTFYDAAIEHGIDIILMAMKPKDVSLHRRIMEATLLTPDMGIKYGGEYSLACVAWHVRTTKSRFFEWVGGEK